MRSNRVVVGLVIALFGGISTIAADTQPAVAAGPDSPAFRQFTELVQQYVKLQKSMPRLRSTKKREEIVGRRRELAREIRENRANAKPGDIFTPEVSQEFLRVIRGAFQGPNAPAVRKTARQGAIEEDWRPTVNGDYPDDLPLTSVPPTLLLHLPRLPSDIAYGIVGHDFVLEDTEARVVIDVIHGALP